MIGLRNWRCFVAILRIGYFGDGDAGAGTTLALNLVGSDFLVCEADKYFMVDGEYRFDALKLKDAHESCQGGLPKILFGDWCFLVLPLYRFLVLEVYMGFLKKEKKSDVNDTVAKPLLVAVSKNGFILFKYFPNTKLNLLRYSFNQLY